MNKPAHYRYAPVPGNHLCQVPEFLFNLDGRMIRGREDMLLAEGKLPVWCLCETGRKASCLLGGYSVSWSQGLGNRVQTDFSPQPLSRWYVRQTQPLATQPCERVSVLLWRGLVQPQLLECLL